MLTTSYRTMIANAPQNGDIKRNVKATLIILPSSLIAQWMEEIATHAEQRVFPKVMQYQSKLGVSQAILEDCQIVLTSYNEVRS